MEDDDNGMGIQYQYLPIIATTTHSQFTYFRPESIRYSAEESWSPLNIMGFRESLAIFLSLPVNYGMRVCMYVCVLLFLALPFGLHLTIYWKKPTKWRIGCQSIVLPLKVTDRHLLSYILSAIVFWQINQKKKKRICILSEKWTHSMMTTFTFQIHP